MNGSEFPTHNGVNHVPVKGVFMALAEELETKSPLTVLLVDDDPSVLKDLKKYLEKEHCTTFEASNAKDALEILNQNKIDVLMTDMVMEGMDGLELLRRTREDSPQTIRILISGQSEFADIVEAVNSGAIYKYAMKPLSEWELRIIISKAREKIQLVRENQQLQKDLEMKNAQLESMNQKMEEMIEQRNQEILAKDQILEHLLEVHTLDESLRFIFETTANAFQTARLSLWMPGPLEEQWLEHICFEWRTGEDNSDGPVLISNGEKPAPKDVVQVANDQQALWPVELNTSAVHPDWAKRWGGMWVGYTPILWHEETVAVAEFVGGMGELSLGDSLLAKVQALMRLTAVAIADHRTLDDLPELEGKVDQLLKDLGPDWNH